MHFRTHIAITALAAPILLTACSLEAYAQDTHSAASPETETSAAPDCPKHDPAAAALPPQEELARDIRTILTGEKSPAQLEALTQATRIAPGQMSDALREVLVDAAAFVSYLDRWDDPVDSRLDSLAHFLVCALQPHFSQEELTADILSIFSFDEQGHYLPGDRARQETAAVLAMHILPGEMEEELQHAAVRGVLSIGPGDYPMHTAWYLLTEALSKQYASYSDADLAAKIRTVQVGEKDIYAIYTPLAAIHGTGRWVHPGYGGIGAPENIGPESRAAITEALAWFNEKINERARLLERREATGDEERKKILEISHREQYHIRFLHRMLEETASSIKEKQHSQQRIKEFRDPFSEPELPPQDELAAAIRAIMEGEEGGTQSKTLRQVARMEPEQIGDSLRAVLKKTFLYKYEVAMQQKEAGADFDFYDSYAESYYEGIMYPLEDAVRQLRDPSLVKFFVHLGRYGICGNEPGSFSDPDGIFSQFPDTSAVLLTEAVSTSTTPLKKMEDGLALLSELAVSHKMGRLRFSHEGRALLIATGRRFLEGGFLSSLPMQDTTGGYLGSRSWVLREAIVFAVALDDPDLIEIVEALATDPDKVTALGIPDEEVENTQETARRLLSWRPYTGISDC